MEIERHQGKVFKSSQNHFCTAGLDHKQLAGLRRDRLCHNRSGTQTQGGASFNFYTLVTSFEIRESAASSCRSHQPGSVWERRRRNLGSGAPPLPTSSLRWDQTLPEALLCCSQGVDYPHFFIFFRTLTSPKGICWERKERVSRLRWRFSTPAGFPSLRKSVPLLQRSSFHFLNNQFDI